MTFTAIALTTAMLAVAPPNTRLLVNAQWLQEHRNDKNLVVLHVTWKPADFDAAHIPNARLLDWRAFVRDGEGAQSELPSPEKLEEVFEGLGVGDNSTVVVYGEPLAAARAFMTLEYLGHRDVRLLDGGLYAWRAAGFATSTETIKAAPGQLTPKVRSFVVDADWVNANRTKPEFVLIDARPINEFTGTDAHNNMHKGGHIPGAQNIYWARLIQSQEEPLLRPEAELRGMFERAGATKDKKVVVYCMLGMRASYSYFVARYLGYDTKFYDGSWVDWSARNLPSVTGGEPVK
jgi:thiosulfate/3-mercaptopyruvate sulfurtransferase